MKTTHMKIMSTLVAGLMSLPVVAYSPIETSTSSSVSDDGEVGSGTCIASRLMEFARIQREYKKVLLSDTLRDALNKHFPTQVERESEDRMTVTSGACRIELELRVTQAEWTDADSETHPRVIEPVVTSRSEVCARGIASRVENYDHSEWMRLLTAATYLSFPDGDCDDYVKKIRYVRADTLELTNPDGRAAEASLSQDVTGMLDEMDND